MAGKRAPLEPAIARNSENSPGKNQANAWLEACEIVRGRWADFVLREIESAERTEPHQTSRIEAGTWRR